MSSPPYVASEYRKVSFNLVWDVATLRWVAMEQPLLDGGTINVTGPVTVAGDVGTLDQFDLSNSNPLSVAIVDASGDQITSFGGGTEYADGAARGSATGVLAMGDDGTNIQSVHVDSSGDLQVDILTGGGQTDAEERAYQTATGTITASGQSVTLALNGATGASVNFIDSSFDGTFRFYSSCDGGTTYIETQAFNVYHATGGTEISNARQAAGVLGFRIWNFALVGGETHVRVTSASGSSGSCAVTIKANDAAPSPTALALGVPDSDTGMPVGGMLALGRVGITTAVRSLRIALTRYEQQATPALATLPLPPTNNVSTITNTNDTATSAQLAAQNVNRLRAWVTNTSSAVLYVLLENSGTASATRFTKRLAQWETWEIPENWIGDIRGVWASDPNDGVAIVTEI